MDFFSLVAYATKYFPKLKIKYKTDSSFMKLLGRILFFNKFFMSSYITTIGSTIYFPKETYVKTLPLSATTVLMHELVHVHDSMRLTNLLYSFLYLFPLSALPIALLLFLVSWKIALPLSILCLLPLPAYFRMVLERRAYFVSLYVLNALSKKCNFNPQLEKQKEHFITQFTSSAYYFMWIFPSIRKQFDDALVKIQAGKRPFEDPIFDILDDLISHCETSWR